MLEVMGEDREVDIDAENYPDNYWDYGEHKGVYKYDVGRQKNVLRLAAEKAGYGKSTCRRVKPSVWPRTGRS